MSRGNRVTLLVKMKESLCRRRCDFFFKFTSRAKPSQLDRRWKEERKTFQIQADYNNNKSPAHKVQNADVKCLWSIITRVVYFIGSLENMLSKMNRFHQFFQVSQREVLNRSFATLTLRGKKESLSTLIGVSLIFSTTFADCQDFSNSNS